MQHMNEWMTGWRWGTPSYANAVVVVIVILLVVLIARRLRHM